MRFLWFKFLNFEICILQLLFKWECGEEIDGLYVFGWWLVFGYELLIGGFEIRILVDEQLSGLLRLNELISQLVIVLIKLQDELLLLVNKQFVLYNIFIEWFIFL